MGGVYRIQTFFGFLYILLFTWPLSKYTVGILVSACLYQKTNLQIVELPKSEPGNVHKCLVFLLICIHIGYRTFLSFVGIEKTLGNFFY